MTNVDEKRRVVPAVLETYSVVPTASVNAARKVGALANDAQLTSESVENGVVGEVVGCKKYLTLLLAEIVLILTTMYRVVPIAACQIPVTV